MNDAAFSARIGSVEELRSRYREPSSLVRSKKLDRLDDTTRRFVAGSPFCMLATSDADGRCDVSPRGGPPGFVRVLDDRRLAIPDLSGNNLLDSLVWDPVSWSELDAPDACEVLVSNLGLDMAPADLRRVADEEYATELAAERQL